MNSLVDRLLRWLRLHKVIPHVPKGVVVCDIGCGPHYAFLKSVAGTIGKGIGLDKRVVPTDEENIEIRKVLLDDMLPLEDASVDVVSMLAMLEHIDEDHAILRECLRILKPGGYILITVPTYWNKPVGEFLAYRLKVIEAEQYRDHKRYYNKEELKDDLEETGFTDIELAYWEFGMNLFAKAYKPHDTKN